MTDAEKSKVLWTENEGTRRVVAMSALIAMVFAIIVLWSDIKSFLAVHPLWQDLLVAVPTIALPILAYFELCHSGEANSLRAVANDFRVKANDLQDDANVLQGQIASLTQELDT